MSAKTIHGESLLGRQTPEYRTWCSIRERCLKKPRYVANGIKVHSDWDSYERFLSDMGRKPSPKHTIDRIDNSKGYEPGNCRWATQKEQQNNKSSNRVLEFNGERLTMTRWAERVGLNPYTLYSRLQRMSVEEALTKPKGKYNRSNVSTSPV